jgi:hypothetical protein
MALVEATVPAKMVLAKVNAAAVRDVAREIYQPGRLCVSAAGPEMSEAKLLAAALPLGKG